MFLNPQVLEQNLIYMYTTKVKVVTENKLLAAFPQVSELFASVTFTSVLVLFSKTEWFISLSFTLVENIVLVCFIFNSGIFFSLKLLV